MSIKDKLRFGFFALVFFVLSVTVTFNLVAMNAGRNFVQINAEMQRTILLLQELRFAGLRVVSSTSEYLFLKGAQVKHGTEEAEAMPDRALGQELELMSQGAENFRRLAAIYRQHVLEKHPDELSLSDAIAAQGEALVENSRKLLATAVQEEAVSASLLAGKEEFEEQEALFLRLISEAVEQERELVVEQERSVISEIESATIWGLLLMSAIAAVILLLGNALLRHVTRRLDALNVAVNDVAKGQFGTRLELRGNDEINALAGNFNKMAGDLERLNADLEGEVVKRTAALEEAQKEIVRGERLAALGQAAATVSHELRNPLGTLQTSLYLIERETADKALGLEAALERANRSLDHCVSIVSEMLDYVKTPKIQCEPREVEPWLEDLLCEEGVLSGGVTLVRNLGAPSAVVSFDAKRLRQALVNVIENACQAIAERHRQEPKAPAGRLDIGTQISENRYRIMIRDNGNGMSEKTRRKLFEPLFSTKTSGTGLGMPIVRQVMELHDGGVEVASKVGEGTAVTLWLPLQGQADMSPGTSGRQ